MICLDTSILIDYFRKKNKEKTILYALSEKYSFAISVITKFEIWVGADEIQREYWNKIFTGFRILSLTEIETDKASDILKHLKATNKVIELPDLLIASTALTNNLKLATINKKHFERITDLTIV
ncbi:MAG TPA: PIN domain nuclease [Bacteroidales bacterium]|nr:PIN domain nuclease [Bacteroidales bacterium]